MKKLNFLLLCVLTSSLCFGQSSSTHGRAYSAGTTKTFPGSTGTPKQVAAALTCNSYYLPGGTAVLNFELNLTNTDDEYGDSVAVIFPAGMTPIAGSPTIGTEAYDGVFGQTVTWGDDDNNFGGIVPGTPEAFSVTVTTTGLTGDQTVNFHVSGDEWGAAPGNYDGTVIVQEQPADEIGVNYMWSNVTYPVIPITQVPGGQIEYYAEVENLGGSTMTNTTVTLDIGAGGYTEDVTVASVASGAVTTVTYAPLAAGTGVYNAGVTLTNPADVNLNNNFDSLFIAVDDSTMMSSLGANAFSGLIAGLTYAQKFEVFNTDSLTSVDLLLFPPDGTDGVSISADIFSMDADTPFVSIATTDSYVLQTTDTGAVKDVFLPITGGYIELTPGTYYIVYNEDNVAPFNQSVLASNDYYTSGASLIQFDGGEWLDISVVGQKTWDFRANFGTVNIPSATCNVSVTAAANDASANGASDGDATATVTGGQSTITYNWSNGGTSASVTGLPAGTYTVTVSDAVLPGCTATASVVVNEPALTCNLLVNVSVTAATTAGGSDGAAAAIVTGDQGTLTYLWSNGGTTAVITGLPSNTYTVTVTDDVIVGCAVTASGLVTDPSVTVACNLTGSATSTDPSANGASDGTATAVAAGSQGNVSYSWSNGGNTQNITGLGDGIYTVTITDDITAGCTATATVTLTEPALSCTLAIATSSNDATTNGGADGDATVTATGGQGNITYLWSNGDATATTTGLTAGTYTVTVSDDVLVGCVETASVTIAEPAALSCTLAATVNSTDASTIGGSNGLATAVVTGDQGTVSYAWSNGGATASITGLTAGTYTVTVTDDVVANCEVVVTATISEPSVGIDNIVSETTVAIFPNPNNGTFTVKTSIDAEYTIVVRNVIGQAVNTAVLNGTMTEVALNNVNAGIYFVTIQSEGFEKTERVIVR
ncbi:T9SS type A sorting domain-containing protein [Flavobacteriales bacterium]|nr:T9SS type A sorting domain-containing protein [Flavobacteriales bacterium]